MDAQTSSVLATPVSGTEASDQAMRHAREVAAGSLRRCITSLLHWAVKVEWISKPTQTE